jgi:hypothetical protein
MDSNLIDTITTKEEDSIIFLNTNIIKKEIQIKTAVKDTFVVRKSVTAR